MPLAPPPSEPQMRAAFDAFPSDVRMRLLALRQQIFAVAAATNGCGEIQETLKWGQPSYLTVRPKSGTTIRLGVPKAGAGRCGLFVHCQTSLVAMYREIYPIEFDYEGTRGLIIRAGQQHDRAALGHCIALALTYHRHKR